MNEDLINSQRDIYGSQFSKYGDSPDSTFNQSRIIQNIRYERLLKNLSNLSDKSTIHDIGCGICDLYDFITVNGYNLIYSGTDIVNDMQILVNKKHPEIQYYIRDVLNSTVEEGKYNYVVLSGTFNLPGDSTPSEWSEFWKMMITKMFDMSNIAISFNFLTSYADYYNPSMCYINPSDVLDFCIKNLSRHVYVDHAYPLFECTVTVSHQDALKSDYNDKSLSKYFKS